MEIFSPGQNFLIIESTDMHFGIMQDLFAAPVENDDRIKRAGLMFLQERYTDCHLQLCGEHREGLHKRTVLADSQPPQHVRILRETVAVAPHLREQRDIRAFFLGFSAGFDPFIQLTGKSLSRKQL